MEHRTEHRTRGSSDSHRTPMLFESGGRCNVPCFQGHQSNGRSPVVSTGRTTGSLEGSCVRCSGPVLNLICSFAPPGQERLSASFLRSNPEGIGCRSDDLDMLSSPIGDDLACSSLECVAGQVVGVSWRTGATPSRARRRHRGDIDTHHRDVDSDSDSIDRTGVPELPIPALRSDRHHPRRVSNTAPTPCFAAPSLGLWLGNWSGSRRRPRFGAVVEGRRPMTTSVIAATVATANRIATANPGRRQLPIPALMHKTSRTPTTDGVVAYSPEPHLAAQSGFRAARSRWALRAPRWLLVAERCLPFSWRAAGRNGGVRFLAARPHPRTAFYAPIPVPARVTRPRQRNAFLGAVLRPQWRLSP